jgi:lipopolysaccharide/colanic/teichoic acid biosynthesis glycosyltransferase
MIKRTFDIVLALLGLILLCPFFLAAAILIKLDSKGPVFFRQVRVGKNGTPFEMLKFRTMMESMHWAGPPVAPRNDPRVTSFGAILRRFKINEFPQLFNVLKGDMSFVGPRPEVPELFAFYGPEEKRIVSVRPGIVGPSQIQMRNEEELYAEDVDPKEYYLTHILPKKLKIDLEYVDNRSFLKDILFIVHGILITLTGAITRRHLFENSEQIAVFVCDTFICAFSYLLAYFLRFEGQLSPVHQEIILRTLPCVVVGRMLALTYYGLYGTLVFYMSYDDLIKVLKGVTVSSLLIILLTFLVGERSHPRSVFAIDWFIVIGLLEGYRMAIRILRRRLKGDRKKLRKRILIYGADGMGDLAVRYWRMERDGEVVGFVDNDPKKLRKRFRGLKILGSRHDIEAIVRLYHVDQVVIATRDIASEELDHIESLCDEADVECEVFALAN